MGDVIIYSIVSKYNNAGANSGIKIPLYPKEQFKLNFTPMLWGLTNSESHQAQDFDRNHASLCLKILADDS